MNERSKERKETRKKKKKNKEKCDGMALGCLLRKKRV